MLLEGDYDDENFFWCEPTKITLFLSDHYGKVMEHREGEKTEKNYFSNIFILSG